MTGQNLPGSDAARHGTGEADLTIMLAAHEAFRRDLVRLARATAAAGPPDAPQRAAVLAGWETFKRQLHLHHTAEDTLVWPTLRQRLAHSEHAQSVLDEMEAEHATIDPLLAAVDDALGEPGQPGGPGGPGGSDRSGGPGRSGGPDRLADVTDALTTSLTWHLDHEERDGLPLIAVALTAAEWRGVGFKIARQAGPSKAGEMFAWIADGDRAGAGVGTLPPPLRLAYRAVWRPRYRRTARW